MNIDLNKIAENAFMEELDKLSSVGSLANLWMAEAKGAHSAGTALAESIRGVPKKGNVISLSKGLGFGVKSGRAPGLSHSMGFGAAEGNVSVIPKSPNAKFGPDSTNSKLYN